MCFLDAYFSNNHKICVLTLRADNRGEGGILSLYALVRRRGKWLVWPAIIGGSALLADGIITPPISVTSAVEGLKIFNKDIPVVQIVIAILVGLFLFQRFGTSVVGKLFGPIMLLWFLTIAIVGVAQITKNPIVLQAFNPMYVVTFLRNPNGFWLLGSVFLCTTGAEALYSDLGHCGRKNIQGAGLWLRFVCSSIISDRGPGCWNMWAKHSMADKPLLCHAAMVSVFGGNNCHSCYDYCQSGIDYRFLYPYQ